MDRRSLLTGSGAGKYTNPWFDCPGELFLQMHGHHAIQRTQSSVQERGLADRPPFDSHYPTPGGQRQIGSIPDTSRSSASRWLAATRAPCDCLAPEYSRCRSETTALCWKSPVLRCDVLPTLRPVTFLFSSTLAPGARRVAVVGPFNGWDPTVHPLVRTVTGHWKITVYLPPGRPVYFSMLMGCRGLTPTFKQGCSTDGDRSIPFTTSHECNHS